MLWLHIEVMVDRWVRALGVTQEEGSRMGTLSRELGGGTESTQARGRATEQWERDQGKKREV